jgi:uncharacterized protein YggE
MSRLGIFVVSLLAVLLLMVGGLLAYVAPLLAPAPQSVAAQAAQATATPVPPPATRQQEITVMGDGSASARPDQAWISVGVQTSKPTAAEALAEANAATEAVLARLDQLGIARANVQTSGLSLFPIQEGAPKQPGADPAITGYRAVNQLTVLVSDLNKVGQVLDGVVAAGANTVGGVRFGLKDDSALRAQALQDAIKSARPKADTMAAGLNLKTGQVLVVQEEGTFSPVAPAAQLAGKGGDVPIEAGQLTVRVRVQVTFALVPTP